MIEIIDKQIVQLNDDIESALRVIKNTLESRIDNASKVETITTMASMLKSYTSQISALNLLKMEVERWAQINSNLCLMSMTISQ